MCYFHKEGTRPHDFLVFEHLPPDKRIVMIGETEPGQAPIIGYSPVGQEGVVTTFNGES